MRHSGTSRFAAVTAGLVACVWILATSGCSGDSTGRLPITAGSPEATAPGPGLADPEGEDGPDGSNGSGESGGEPKASDPKDWPELPDSWPTVVPLLDGSVFGAGDAPDEADDGWYAFVQAKGELPKVLDAAYQLLVGAGFEGPKPEQSGFAGRLELRGHGLLVVVEAHDEGLGTVDLTYLVEPLG